MKPKQPTTAKKKRKDSGVTLLRDFGPVKLKQVVAIDHGYEYKTFMVEGVDVQGRRLRRKFKDREEAEGWASVQVPNLMNQRSGLHSAVTRLSEAQLQECEGAYARLGVRYTLTEAVDYFLRHFQAPDFEISLRDASKKFLEDKERELVRANSIYQLERTIAQFSAFVGEDTNVHEVTPKEIEGYLMSLRSREGGPAKAKTWNNYRNDLGSFFGWCSADSRKWCSENPVTSVRKFKQKSVDQQRPEPEILTPEGAEKILRFLEGFKEGAYVRYFALLMFAGIRPAEAEKLARDPRQGGLIDLATGEIEIPADIAKTGATRTVAIQPNLRKWLEAFPGSVLPEKNIDRCLKLVRKTFSMGHDVCRHSWFTYMVAQFDSVERAAVQGGNSETIVRKHYLRIAKGRKAQALKYWNIVPEGAKMAIPSKAIPFSKGG